MARPNFPFDFPNNNPFYRRPNYNPFTRRQTAIRQTIIREIKPPKTKEFGYQRRLATFPEQFNDFIEGASDSQKITKEELAQYGFKLSSPENMTVMCEYCAYEFFPVDGKEGDALQVHKDHSPECMISILWSKRAKLTQHNSIAWDTRTRVHGGDDPVWNNLVANLQASGLSGEGCNITCHYCDLKVHVSDVTCKDDMYSELAVDKWHVQKSKGKCVKMIVKRGTEFCARWRDKSLTFWTSRETTEQDRLEIAESQRALRDEENRLARQQGPSTSRSMFGFDLLAGGPLQNPERESPQVPERPWDGPGTISEDPIVDPALIQNLEIEDTRQRVTPPQPQPRPPPSNRDEPVQYKENDKWRQPPIPGTKDEHLKNMEVEVLTEVEKGAPFEQVKDEYRKLRTMAECKYCLTNMATVLLLPCRHMTACPDCNKRMSHQDNRCPLCRQQSTHKIGAIFKPVPKPAEMA